MKSLNHRLIYTYLLVLTFSVFIGKLQAQKLIPQWKWAVSAGDYYFDCNGSSITVDSLGNTYVTGSFYGIATFGNAELTSLGYSDIFVAKLNKNQKWEWAIRAGGKGSSESGVSIKLDKSGNTYITGHIEDSAEFGKTILRSKGNDDLFIAKINENGQWAWAVSAGGTENDYGTSIAIDPSGNIYVTGWFTESATFGGANLKAAGTFKRTEDIFVSKLDSNGNWQWTINAGGIRADRGHSISTDISGNIYITGWVYDTVSFGNTTLIPSGFEEFFVAKLNSNGEWQWAVRAQGWIRSNYIAVDSLGNAYITGTFMGGKFGDTTLNTFGHADIFVSKLDSNGKWQWTANAGGEGYAYGNSITVSSSGNVYLTGYFESSATGFPAKVVFGSTTLTSLYGHNKIFVAKIDSSGKWVGAVDAAGTEYSGEGSSIASDVSGDSYVTGNIFGTATFGSTTLKPSQRTYLYIVKLHDEIVTGIQDKQEANETIKLYPNPATNVLTIETSKPTNTPIIITDITGRQVFQINRVNEKTINLDISSLAKGLYLISIDQTTHKFIKE